MGVVFYGPQSAGADERVNDTSLEVYDNNLNYRTLSDYYHDEYISIMEKPFFDYSFKKAKVRLVGELTKEFLITEFDSDSAYLYEGCPIINYRLANLKKIGDQYRETSGSGFTHIIVKNEAPYDPSKMCRLYFKGVGRTANIKGDTYKSFSIFYPYLKKAYKCNVDNVIKNLSDLNPEDNHRFKFIKGPKHFAIDENGAFGMIDKVTGNILIDANKRSIIDPLTSTTGKYKDSIKDGNINLLIPEKTLLLVADEEFVVDRIETRGDLAKRGIMIILPELLYLVNGKILCPHMYKKIPYFRGGIVLNEPLGETQYVMAPRMRLDSSAIIPGDISFNEPETIKHIALYHMSIALAQTKTLMAVRIPSSGNISVIDDEFNNQHVKPLLKSLYGDPGVGEIVPVLILDNIFYIVASLCEDENYPIKSEINDNLYKDILKRTKEPRGDLNPLYDILADYMGSEVMGEILIDDASPEVLSMFKSLTEHFEHLTLDGLGLKPGDKRILLPQGRKRTARYNGSDT